MGGLGVGGRGEGREGGFVCGNEGCVNALLSVFVCLFVSLNYFTFYLSIYVYTYIYILPY